MAMKPPEITFSFVLQVLVKNYHTGTKNDIQQVPTVKFHADAYVSVAEIL